jgi:tetratricopeptide (TPR) repeat protein
VSVRKLKSHVLAALALFPLIASAQRPVARDPLKRGAPPAPVRPTCPPPPAAIKPTDVQRQQARDLAQRSQQAAILGDSLTARDELRRAVGLDPTDPDLAYRLARAHETVGASTDAAKEYCRFLTLAPSAPEAVEARERVALLIRPTSSLKPEVDTTFRRAIAAYERGQMAEAEASFSKAIAAQPDWADAYYDRALALLARGQRERALRDFEQYLRLRPEADDRTAVVARINALRRGAFSPSAALSIGLVPGGGQFYTQRPVRGVLMLAAVGGAVAFALQERSTSRTVSETATDPFGNPYTYTTSRLKTTRPNLIPGLAAAGAVTLAGAIEAFVFARGAGRSAGRVALNVTPRLDAVSVGLTVR